MKNVLLFKTSDKSSPSWHIVVKDNRRDVTIAAISYCGIQVVGGNFQNRRCPLEEGISKRVCEPYTIDIILGWLKKKLKLKDIGLELMSKGNMFKCSRTVFSIRCFMLILTLAKTSPTLRTDIEASTSSTLAQYDHLTRGSFY